MAKKVKNFEIGDLVCVTHGSEDSRRNIWMVEEIIDERYCKIILINGAWTDWNRTYNGQYVTHGKGYEKTVWKKNIKKIEG